MGYQRWSQYNAGMCVVMGLEWIVWLMLVRTNTIQEMQPDFNALALIACSVYKGLRCYPGPVDAWK